MAREGIHGYIHSASIGIYTKAAALLDADLGHIEPPEVIDELHNHVPGVPRHVSHFKEPCPCLYWEIRDKALAHLRTRGIAAVEQIIDAAQKAVAEQPAAARDFHGWSSFLSELAIRSFEELSEKLDKKLGPDSPIMAGGNSNPYWRDHQDEVNHFTQDLTEARNELAQIAVAAGTMIEDNLDREREAENTPGRKSEDGTQDSLLTPVPDERSVDGKRYARIEPLPRAPWEGIRHPKTGKMDVSTSIHMERSWMTVGYPELGEVQLALKPHAYTQEFYDLRREELHDIYERAGVMALDGVNADWVHDEWTKCHVFGKHAAQRFIELACEYPQHLLIAKHVKASWEYQASIRELTTRASREADLAYNSAVSKVRSQWLRLSKGSGTRVALAWDSLRQAMREIARKVSSAYGRFVSELLELKSPPISLVFIDRKQDGTRTVRREKPLGRKGWLNNADCKLVSLLAAFDEAVLFKSRELKSPVEVVAVLGGALARSEHGSAGLDEMPGWKQASEDERNQIAGEYEREIRQCRALCGNKLRAAFDGAVAAARNPAKKRSNGKSVKRSKAAASPDYANDSRYVNLAAGALDYNIPKSYLSKAARRKPGEPGYLRCERVGRNVFFLRADLEKVARSRPRSGI